MYSSRARSITVGAGSASRKPCAFAACAASSRPSQMTSPFPPSRISNIALLPQAFRNRNAAFPVRIVVLEAVGELADQVQAEATRPASVDWQGDIDRRAPRDVERGGGGVG